ncbi:TDP-N-acetylfucosamine:lipid II N-acetylfucosaminyltransferase family protein [Aliiglaciecola aliphaticivorans]
MIKYVHIMISEKFMPPYIDFIQENFDESEHLFIYITSEKYQFGLTPSHNVKFMHTDDDFLCLANILKAAEKIILHGLWRDKINHLLVTNPILLKKAYWVMWGADYYLPESKSEEHREVIKNVGYCVTHIKGDIALIKKSYQAKGQHINCFAYTSNLYRQAPININRDHKKKIIVGNSAALNNNHIAIFDRLYEHSSDINQVIVPLSYAKIGGKRYINQVIEHGQSLFGEKFKPLLDFLTFDEYMTYLKNIDIAIYDHNRQQGMGTLITLLSLGVKVFIRPSVATWDLLTSQNIQIFDTNKLSLEGMSEKQINNNIYNLKKHYSEKMLVKQWQSIFN